MTWKFWKWRIWRKEPEFVYPEYVIHHYTMIRIWSASGPQVNDTECLDCGGKIAACSPPMYAHTKECRGLARSNAVYDLFKENKR